MIVIKNAHGAKVCIVIILIISCRWSGMGRNKKNNRVEANHREVVGHNIII